MICENKKISDDIDICKRRNCSLSELLFLLWLAINLYSNDFKEKYELSDEEYFEALRYHHAVLTKKGW